MIHINVQTKDPVELRRLHDRAYYWRTVEHQREKQRAQAMKHRESRLIRAKRYAETHRPQIAARMKKDYDAHREEYLAKNKKWRLENADKAHAGQKAYRELHREEIKGKSRQWRRNLKAEMIEAYGGKCACCGCAVFEFLTLDHPNGNGAEERRAMFGPKNFNTSFYTNLKRRGWPQEGYRLLCFNCNCSIGCYGYCPHQKELPSEGSNSSSNS